MAIKTPKETIIDDKQVRVTTKKSVIPEQPMIDNSAVKSSKLVRVEIEKLLQEIILKSAENDVKSAAQRCIKLLSNM